MATFIWQGNGAGTKTDMQDGRNWLNENGATYAQTRYPGSVTGEQDDVIVSTALGTYLAPKTNTDFSAKEVWRSLHVGSAYDGDIGDASNLLHIQCLSVVIDGSSAGNIYLKGVTTGSINITELIVSGGKATKTLWLDGKFKNVILMKHEGAIELAANAIVSDSLKIKYINSPTTDIKLFTIGTNVTLPSEIYHDGGKINCSSAIAGTYHGTGGTWYQLKGNIANYELNGATLYWNAGNLGAGVVYSGELNGEQTNTIKRCSNIEVYTNGKIYLNDGVGNIILDGYIHNYGSSQIRLPMAYKTDRYTVETIAGASDAVLGIPPQNIAAGATVNGTAVLLGLNDTLTILCQVGVTDATTIAFEVYEDATVAHDTETALAGKSVSFNATDNNKTKAIIVKGYELSAGKYSVRIKATVTGGTSGLCSSAYVLKKP